MWSNNSVIFSSKDTGLLPSVQVQGRGILDMSQVLKKQEYTNNKSLVHTV